MPTGNVCQLVQEAVCHYDSDCPRPLVCAVDQQCRNQCNGDRDCAQGQVCASGVCTDGVVPPSGPAKCFFDSDCSGGLVCAFGLCHAECATSKDCPINQRCVASSTPDSSVSARVCQLPPELICHYNTDCFFPLVCAADHECRNECNANRDCIAGQICTTGVCAEPSEVAPSGQLKGAVDAG